MKNARTKILENQESDKKELSTLERKKESLQPFQCNHCQDESIGLRIM